MARNSSTPVKTFSIGFEEEYNELSMRGSRALQTEHHERSCALMRSTMHRRWCAFDELFADSSMSPTYYVRARRAGT
jgi:hypothetical protein